jgi:benzoate-CoA ligase
MDSNAASWFVDRHPAEGRAGSPAFHLERDVLTYGQVQELANRTGNALLALGVERGERVLLLALDAPEFLGTFWGALKIGAVPVPVNTFLKEADYRYFLADSRATAAVVSAPLLGPSREALRRAPSLRSVLVAGGEAGPFLSFEECVARASADLATAPASPGDVAFWLYSSGSTGAPKAAMHRHGCLRVCHETYARRILELGPTDKVYSASKLFFAYGLGNAGYFPLGAGAQSVLVPHRTTAEALFATLARHRPTVFFAVPTLYAQMLAHRDAGKGCDLSFLRLCVSAGEALPAGIYDRWREAFGVELLDGIGTTEMLHIFISNRPGAARPGSAGVPVPGYDAQILDDEGEPVARGEVGNLLVAGDSTMAGYWNQEEKTRRAVSGRWLRTGDQFYQDADGYFWHVGRSDDMLKVGGLWVSPVEVEGALIAHPAVLEAAVVGRENRDGLVKPRAFVVLKEGVPASEPLAAEIMAWVRSRVAAYKVPAWIEVVPELPKTPTGKLQRFKLRESAVES